MYMNRKHKHFSLVYELLASVATAPFHTPVTLLRDDLGVKWNYELNQAIEALQERKLLRELVEDHRRVVTIPADKRKRAHRLANKYWERVYGQQANDESQDRSVCGTLQGATM